MSEFYFKTIERKIRYYFLLVHHFLTYSVYSWLTNKEIKKDKIKSILVIETLFIGDLIVATPVFKVLRENFPNAKIYALVLDRSSPVLYNNPNITEIITISKQINAFNPVEFISLLKKIKNKDINLGILLHPGSWSASLLMILSGITYRIGCTQSGILNGKGMFLTHKAKPYKQILNVVEQNIQVLTSAGINSSSNLHTEIFIVENEENEVIKKFKLKNDEKYLGINVCSSHISQHWNKFSELIESILKNKRINIILTGESTCIQYLNTILANVKNKNNTINLCGKTNLRELFSVVKQMKLLISVDSSTPHIAAALNVPTITLYGPGFPETWKPWNKNAEYIINDKVCTRCRQHYCIWSFLNKKREFECTKSISIHAVLARLNKVGL